MEIEKDMGQSGTCLQQDLATDKERGRNAITMLWLTHADGGKQALN